jgi:hypothetical protein
MSHGSIGDGLRTINSTEEGAHEAVDVRSVNSTEQGAHEAVEDQMEGALHIFARGSGATLCDRCCAILVMVDKWPYTLEHQNIHSLEASAREGCIVCFVQSASESTLDELRSQTSISDKSGMLRINQCHSCAVASRPQAQIFQTHAVLGIFTEC